MAETKKSVFETLSAINVNEHTEKKNGLTYLSWAWAWQVVKQNYPTASYTVYEAVDGIPYFNDGETCWVKTGVTIEGLEHIEYLPIMDFRNVSIPLAKVTSMDMNKTIQRSLTKCCARHGLGLYIYAGEDLPDTPDQPGQAEPQNEPIAAVKARRAAAGRKPAATAPEQYTPMDEDTYWKLIAAYGAGRKTKTGGDIREAWMNATHADAEALMKWDNDVDNWRAANI